MRLTLNNARATFHYVALAGLVLALIVGAWDVAGVIFVAALTVHFAYQCVRAGPDSPIRLMRKAASKAATLMPAAPEPAAQEPAAREESSSSPCAPQPPQRVPLYKDQDWNFVKPVPWGGITEQTFLRPSTERVIEPLHARQAFVKEWAKDADAFAVKDRYTIKSGGTHKIQRRF